MRKESKKLQNVRVANVQGYHQESGYSRTEQNYVYQGYTKVGFFNSDRFVPCTIVNENMVKADGSPIECVGLEIETECTGIRKTKVLAEVCQKVIFPNFKFGADMFKLQRDGSLGGTTSVEMITLPMTVSRIRNDYAAYQTMFDVYFPACGISADSNTTSCGMHVNLSNAFLGKTEDEQIDTARKLHYVINNNYEFFCKALYRSIDRNDWCRRMFEDSRELDVKHMRNDHTKCLNYSHFCAGRIEIRLVGGQKDFECFRETMETVFHVIKRLRSLDWNELSLVKLFTGCNQYVFNRLSACANYFTAAELDTLRNKVKYMDLDLE